MQIREAKPDDAPGVAKVHVETWRATYAHFLPQEYLAAMSYDKSTKMFRSHFKYNPPEIKTFVADMGGSTGIVGASTGGYNALGHEAYQAELLGIYILPAFQRKGVGRQLLRAVKAHLLEIKARGMLVWVFNENPNRAFYEHIGGTFIEERLEPFGKKEVKKVALGWTDIHDVKV